MIIMARTKCVGICFHEPLHKLRLIIPDLGLSRSLFTFFSRKPCYNDAILPTMQQPALSQREQAVKSSGVLLQAKRLPLHGD